MSIKGDPADREWAEYREEVFGTPYMVWHDGPYFEPIADDFAENPAYVMTMVKKGILENDDVAAQVPRELDATDEQKSAWIAMLEECRAAAYGSTQTEIATSLHELGADSPDLAQDVIVMLLAPHNHWGVKLDAARRLERFPHTPEIVAALVQGAQDEEYLVRFHSANALLHWSGSTKDISDVDDVFTLLVKDDDPAAWRRAADQLAEAVKP